MDGREFIRRMGGAEAQHSSESLSGTVLSFCMKRCKERSFTTSAVKLLQDLQRRQK